MSIPKFAVGQKVKVIAGPYKGHYGKITSAKQYANENWYYYVRKHWWNILEHVYFEEHELELIQ
jgi:ribosomal protein L24